MDGEKLERFCVLGSGALGVGDFEVYRCSDVDPILARLREALVRYGDHDDGCTLNYTNLVRDCTCGLSRALAQEEDR